MKYFVCFFLLCTHFTASADETVISKERFQRIIEMQTLCGNVHDDEKYVDEHVLKRAAESFGFETRLFKYVEEEGAGGYQMLLTHHNSGIKIFDFDLMAVFVEPAGFHSLALLGTDKESVINLINSKDFEKYPVTITYLYPPKPNSLLERFVRFILQQESQYDYSSMSHAGLHMAEGGYNSNRVLFMLPRSNWRSIEVESCEDTKSKWFISVCNQFNRKPMTWVGCAHTPIEHHMDWGIRP